jgi:hypothetical protein
MIWQSGTSGTLGSRLAMQPDGSLALTDMNGLRIWAEPRDSRPGSLAWVQDDGNLVVYDSNFNPTWASNTCCR